VKQHKPRFDKECLGFLDKRKQAKLKWLQDPNQRNVDNLNSVRWEASIHFRHKEEEHPKAKIDELDSNNEIKNIRDLSRSISDFKNYHVMITIHFTPWWEYVLTNSFIN
jgi:hypothetical protein